MKKALFVALAFTATSAFAMHCPKDMKAIDAALPKAKLSADQMAEVKKLRAEGEALLGAAVLLYATNEMRILELNVFALTLAIQSLPYLAATLMGAIEKYESSSLGRRLPLVRLSPAK